MPADHGANPWLADADDVQRGVAYQRRLEARATAGEYLHAEADLVQSLLPGASPGTDERGRPAGSVLDAGCGTGRVGIELARRGVDVVGVDLDRRMIDVARSVAPDVTWLEGDLATLDLARTVDVVVAAGNVMVYLTPGTGPAVVRRLTAHLRPNGALVAGFALHGGPSGVDLPLAEYDGWCAAAGLTLDRRLATWEGARYDGDPYAVSIHRRG